MKSKLLSHRCRIAPGLLLGLALLAASLVSAQNFVKNPDFEEPLGPDNWTIVYTGVVNGPTDAPTNCGPYDFLIAGRTTMAHRDMVPGTWDGHPYYWSKLGGHFAPNHDWLMHAYFKQVITGLRPGFLYDVSSWMAQYTRNDNWLNNAQVYMEAIGGINFNVIKRTAYVTANVNNNPAGWQRYTLSNVVASASGQIEIRLHYNKMTARAQAWEYRNQNAYFDHVSLVPAGQPEYRPPFKLLSFQRANQNVTLKWETVMNHSYRLQVSTNLSDPGSWAWVKWSPYLDTNIHALTTNYTFQTNLSSLFAYDPNFDPNSEVYFRIYAEPFAP